MLESILRKLWYKEAQALTLSLQPSAFSLKPLALSLFLFILCLLSANTVLAGNVTLAWNPPTERVDGTPVTSSDIKGYNLHYGTSSGNYTQNINVGNTTSYTVTNLTDGANYYFAVSAIDTADKESGYSTEACKTIGTTTTTCVTTTISNGGSNNNNNFSTGGDTEIGGGGGGCGFVKNDGKGQKAKGEGLSLIIMLIIVLTGIALAKRRTGNITATREGVLVMETRKNSLIKTAAISFLLTIFWSASAYAQPQITSFSGSLSDGSTITINGNSFGANGPNIVVFDNFESGTNGSNIKTGVGSATIGKWDAIGGGFEQSPPTYDYVYSVSGNMAMKSDYTKDYASAAKLYNLNTRDAFVSYWYFLPTTSSFPYNNSEGGGNWKIAWLYGTDTTVDDKIIPGGYPGPINESTNPINSGWAIDCNGCYNNPMNWFNFTFYKGVWYRASVWVHGTSDSSGKVQLSIVSPGKNMANNLLVDWSGQVFNNASSQFLKFSISAYAKQCFGCTESAPRYDDVYLATGPNARARVEIGNNPTYNSCTNLTIATVTSWSDTSITATIRQGSFANFNNAYLYVIDANGNVNTNGYALCPSCLKPPTW